jgi:hypothetical protein
MIPEVIATFAKVGRVLMREYMEPASCIGAVRTTIETLKIFDLKAYEIPVAYYFEVPAKKYARISGWTEKEREEIQAEAATYQDETAEGWNGHLLVVVEDTWVLDPSVDQMSAPQFGVIVPAETFYMDTKGKEFDPSSNFEIKLGLVLDSGDLATLTYHRIRDPSYLETDAWNDEGLPFLGRSIALAMAVERLGQWERKQN